MRQTTTCVCDKQILVGMRQTITPGLVWAVWGKIWGLWEVFMSWKHILSIFWWLNFYLKNKAWNHLFLTALKPYLLSWILNEKEVVFIVLLNVTAFYSVSFWFCLMCTHSPLFPWMTLVKPLTPKDSKHWGENSHFLSHSLQIQLRTVP